MNTPSARKPNRALGSACAGTWLGVSLLALALWQTGCATPKPPQTENFTASPRTPPALTTLGTIGVTSTSTVPKFAFLEPLKRDEAGERTARKIIYLGENDTIEEGARIAHQLTCGMSFLAAIAVAVPSRVVAERLAISEKSRAKACSSLQEMIAHLSLQDELRARVVQQSTARGFLPVRMVRKPFPPGQEAEFSRMSCVMAGTLAWLPPGQTAKDYLAAQGVDTVLELQLIHPGLKGAGKINPSLALCVDVQARLVEAGNGRELWRCAAQYRSAKHKFATWGADKAQLFRCELDRCFASLAEQIVDQLFGGSGQDTGPAGVKIAQH